MCSIEDRRCPHGLQYDDYCKECEIEDEADNYKDKALYEQWWQHVESLDWKEGNLPTYTDWMEVKIAQYEADHKEIYNIVNSSLECSTGLSQVMGVREVFRRRAALTHTPATTADEELRMNYIWDATYPAEDSELTNNVQSFQDTIDSLKQRNKDLEKDAARYRWLRERNLDTVYAGGVFAGKTPENLILNGEDLDVAIDAALNPTPTHIADED